LPEKSREGVGGVWTRRKSLQLSVADTLENFHKANFCGIKPAINRPKTHQILTNFDSKSPSLHALHNATQSWQLSMAVDKLKTF
jgi:hypothetical protein